MKSLNTIKFVSNAIEELTKYNEAISAAKTFEDAKNKARMMMGYIDALLHGEQRLYRRFQRSLGWLDVQDVPDPRR